MVKKYTARELIEEAYLLGRNHEHLRNTDPSQAWLLDAHFKLWVERRLKALQE